MPYYTFQSGKKIQDFFFSMNDAPSLGSEIEIEGVRWKRVILEAPGAAVSSISNIDPRSAKEFASVTGAKNGTYGDLIDLSAELAAKRAEKDGKDYLGEKEEARKKEKMDARKARNKARSLAKQKTVAAQKE